MLNPLNSEGNEVPENLILITPWNLSTTNEKINEIIQPLVGQRKRDWFEPQTYKCLALQIGNQYGFVIKAEQDFSVVWNGGEHTTDVIVDKSIKSEDNPSLIQDQKSHFGSGIVIIENKWILRTPPKVNLMTVQPPNWFKRGIAHMTGVIETDNLRRNFIFGLKITEPNLKIEFKKGEPIACFIVLPPTLENEPLICSAAMLAAFSMSLNPDLVLVVSSSALNRMSVVATFYHLSLLPVLSLSHRFFLFKCTQLPNRLPLNNFCC